MVRKNLFFFTTIILTTATTALLRQARVAWQLSIREGFEVKVTEALLKGTPVIATKAGGIPLQVRDGETGFLVEIGDVQRGP